MREQIDRIAKMVAATSRRKGLEMADVYQEVHATLLSAVKHGNTDEAHLIELGRVAASKVRRTTLTIRKVEKAAASGESTSADIPDLDHDWEEFTSSLSPRDKSVFLGLLAGDLIAVIAKREGINERTVKRSIQETRRKLKGWLLLNDRLPTHLRQWLIHHGP